MNSLIRLLALIGVAAAATACVNGGAQQAPAPQSPAPPGAGAPAAPAGDGLPAQLLPAEPMPALAGLPLPSVLAGQLSIAGGSRTASYLPADLLREAEAFDAALPHQHVTATPGGAAFAPDWLPPSPDIAGLSYAMYPFNVKGFGGNPVLYYSWIDAPPVPTDVYFALANWGNESWDWFTATADNYVRLEDMSEYIVFGGTMLVCVVAVGTDESELDWLRLGSQPPQPALTASPNAGLTPLHVDFDASGSSDSDSSIALYRWDPQGDGSFDVSTGTDPHYTFEYTSAGNYQAAVRVVDNHGVYADQAITVSAVDDVNFSFGAEEASDAGVDVLRCTDDDLLLFINKFVEDPFSWQIVQAKVSLTGETRFVKSWTDNGRVDVFDAVADAEGNFYVCGQDTANGTYDALLQKWNQNGELLWSKTVGTDIDAEVFNALCLAGDCLIVCGDWYSYSLLRHFGILLRFDLSGNKVWDYSLIGPVDCTLKDIAFYSTPEVGTPSLYVCGEFNPSYSDTDAFYATFDTDGNLYSGMRWGDAGSSRESAAAISVRGVLNPTAYVAGSIVNPGTRSFFAKPGAATVVLSGGANIYLEAADLLGLTLLARRSGTGISPGMALATFDSALALVGQREFSTASGSYYPAKLAPYGASSFAITGTQYGALPTEAPLTLSAETSPLAWTNVAVPMDNPEFTVLDTPVTLEDHSGYEINRLAADGDAFILLKKW